MITPKTPPKTKAHPKLLGRFSNCCCILPSGALLSGETLRIEYPINRQITPTNNAITPAISNPPPLLIQSYLQKTNETERFKPSLLDPRKTLRVVPFEPRAVETTVTDPTSHTIPVGLPDEPAVPTHMEFIRLTFLSCLGWAFHELPAVLWNICIGLRHPITDKYRGLCYNCYSKMFSDTAVQEK